MTSTSEQPATGRTTFDAKLAKVFGLKGEMWLRHANPISAYTRFAVLPLLAISIWQPPSGCWNRFFTSGSAGP